MVEHRAMALQKVEQPASRSTISVIAICVANHAAMTGSRFAVAVVGLQLGMSAGLIGLCVALFAFVPAISSIWLGRWTDASGPGTPAIFGMSLTATGLVLPAIWLSPATLAIAAGGVGAGYAMVGLSTQREIGHASRGDEKLKWLSRFALGTALSSSAGPLVAGYSLTNIGTRQTFLIAAAVVLISLIRSLTECRRDGLDDLAENPTHDPRQVRRLLADGSIRSLLIVDLLMAVAWNANTFLVPIFGVRHGWRPDETSRLLAVFGAAVLLVRALPHRYRAEGSQWLSIRVALASSAVCLAALTLCSQIVSALLLEALMGLGLGGALSSVLTLLHKAAPVARLGEALGLRLLVLNASAIVLPLLIGALTAAVDLSLVMLLASIMVACGFVAASRAERSLPV
jgi:predicted MFS family arabinose efflux permease